MFERFRRNFLRTTTGTAAPAAASATSAPVGGENAEHPAAGAERRDPNDARRERTLPAQLSGLEHPTPARSGFARARDKMRHRHRDLAIPFFQTGHSGQAIGPQDVAHPRYARVDHAGIDPAHTPLPDARIARYAKRVQERSTEAPIPVTDRAAHPAGAPGIVDRQRQAATGEAALHTVIDDTFAAPVLPALAPIEFDLAAEFADALGWERDADPGARVIAGATGEPLHERTVLTRRLAGLGGPRAGGETTYGALIAAALTHAGIDHPRIALDVLDRCATLPLETLASATTLRALDERGQQAVHLMSILTRGNRCNFEAFMALRADAGHPIVATHHAQAVQALLGAADHTVQGAGPTHAGHNGMPRPAAGRSDPPARAITDTLADALSARGDDPAAALPQRTITAAAQWLTQGSDALPERARYDLFSWRQGDRDDAPGSDLSRKNHRLEKFVKQTIPRVAQSRWERARTLPRRVLGMNKSPLSAATLGLGGVPRDTLQNEQARLAEGMRETLAELTHASAGETPPLDPAAALHHADPAGSLMELAALHIWLEGGFHKDRVATADLPTIAARAHALARDAVENGSNDAVEVAEKLLGLAARDGAVLRETPPFNAIDGRHYTAASLARWGAIAGVPHTADTPLRAQVEHLRQLANPVEKRLDERSVARSQELLIEVIGALKPGARLRLSDGHRYGLSTRGLSVAFSNLLHLSSVPMSVQANLGIDFRKEAVVEISRTLQGIEIFIGTARRTATHAETGVFAGYKFDLGLAEARAGGAVNVLLHAGDSGTVRGVLIGVGRRPNDMGTGYQDAAMLKKAALIVSELFADADIDAGRTNDAGETGHAESVGNTESAGSPENAAGGSSPAPSTASAAQRVFARHFDDADLTLAWTDTTDKGYSEGVSVSGGITLRLPGPADHDAVTGDHTHPLLPLGLGPTVGLAYVHDHGYRQDTSPAAAASPGATREAAPARQDAQRVEQHRQSGGSRWIGRIGMGTSANVTVNAGDAGRSIGLGLLTLDTPAMHFTFRNTRMSARLQLVREQRQLNHRACVLDREFAGPSAYIHAVESERAQWAELFAAEQMRTHGVPKDTALKDAHGVIDRHLANARANWRPNQVLFTRHRLREHAARTLDLHAALRDQLAPGAPDTPDALRALNEADARILEDGASYMPVELKGKESVGRERLIGPNAFLHLGARKAVASTRDFVAQNVGFRTMNDVDDALPRAPVARSI